MTPSDHRDRAARLQAGRPALPPALAAEIESCGYFPEVVIDAAALACGVEEVLDHLIHHEATFEMDEIHRHLTVILRTPTRLIICHTDDRTENGQLQAITSSESIPFGRVSSVVLTRVIAHPESFGHAVQPAGSTVETWLQIAWGAVSRIDLAPADCGDPTCEADHGYTGNLSGDDITIRMSPAADGSDQVARLVAFATRLQQVATGGDR
ncbi:DUF5998 family protein [Acidipropionibacterium virtanenii]|uniref:Phosphodiesterase n=1 Tax=Acidipropionibacterium virtanenii TaxID=2057246 RepID=A0A344UUJ0_9ACTN|nr:DUF5998 family protein [Acidipropionibacterium virtanenii]AXE38938.1 hypothetical protein JS278_01779 [Acidipropionibacterium virtanenii]